MLQQIRRYLRTFLVFSLVVHLSLISIGRSRADDLPQTLTADQLSGLSLDQLTNLEVTSPSKKPQNIADVSSAIYVLTEEDIRRSGATSIPELLRLVPGLDVGRIDNNQYAISARGFNALFGDKLLVLMDGRSIYTPLFGGVFWNEQDTLLEDIERIEVIRGPGAALYGANATNGVINIITKSARRTQGGLASFGGGSQERGFGSAQYGGQIADTHYRTYAKYFYRAPNHLESGGKAHDNWQGTRAGFRTDTRVSDDDLLTVQGDYYYGESGWDNSAPSLEAPFRLTDEINRYVNGGNLLGRWTREIDDSSELQLQMYYDHNARNDQLLGQRHDTLDFDIQHRFNPIKHNEILYGLGYRFYQDSIDNGDIVSVDPQSRNVDLFTGFIQDEISLIEETLRLIVGSKVEHNVHSGWEIMPNVRLVGNPDEKSSIWAAVSSAVRSPARFNDDGKIFLAAQPTDAGLPAVVSLRGDRDYDSEKLLAYETGYRAQLQDWLSLDLAGFYNDYDDLESTEPLSDPFLSSFQGAPVIEVPLQVDNKLEGHSYGGELALELRPTSQWRIVPSYAYLNLNLHRVEDSQDTIFIGGEGQSPEHQYLIRSLLTLPHDVEFDVTWRAISSIPTFDVAGYNELDVRIGWRPTEKIEIALVGQNLLNEDHLEFASNLVDTARTEIKRGVYGKLTLLF